MKRFLPCLTALLVGSLLCGCSTYHKFNNTSGYSDSPLRKDTYLVSFVARNKVSAVQVLNWAMLRCAELTVEKGLRFFEPIQSETEIRHVQNYTPEQTAEHVTTTKDTDGHKIIERTFTTTPGYYSTDQFTIVKITMKIVDAPTQESLDALELLYLAKQQGIKFSRAAEAALTQTKKQ